MNLYLYIAIAISLIFLILVIWIIRLERKLYKLLGNKNNTLDESIDSIRKDVNLIKKYIEVSEDHFETIDGKLKRVISGVKTIRFNPFKANGGGGNQSFATALINEEGDGTVISSLYSRDHISIFSKPITNLNSEFDLSEEEKDALQKAKESIK